MPKVIGVAVICKQKNFIKRSEAIQLLLILAASRKNGLPRRCAPRNDVWRCAVFDGNCVKQNTLKSFVHLKMKLDGRAQDSVSAYQND